jgi:C1A family cysteine protease
MATKEPMPVRARSVPAKRQAKRYGWIPDLPDQRDHMFSAPLALLRPLPERVDLRSNCPPVYDQGELGSCTANAIAAALEFDQMKQRADDVFVPSRLFIYYNERSIEGTVDEDAGAMLRDGMKSVAKDGAPHERLWPYTISRFRSRPTLTSYTDAARHPAVLYQRLTQDLMQLKGCLAAGFPFVFGFAVYESFEWESVAKTGRVPLPDPEERQLGGHAAMAVGYDESQHRFFVRNSWGPNWGMSGYCSMPFDYLLDGNLSDDFWTIRAVR